MKPPIEPFYYLINFQFQNEKYPHITPEEKEFNSNSSDSHLITYNRSSVTSS